MRNLSNLVKFSSPTIFTHIHRPLFNSTIHHLCFTSFSSSSNNSSSSSFSSSSNNPNTSSSSFSSFTSNNTHWTQYSPSPVPDHLLEKMMEMGKENENSPPPSLPFTVTTHQYEYHFQTEPIPIHFTVFKPLNPSSHPIPRVLCIPPFSLLSSRSEYNTLGGGLCTQLGMEVTLMDWAGFNTSVSAAKYYIVAASIYSPKAFSEYLQDFIALHYFNAPTFQSISARLPQSFSPINIIAAGHSLGYILPIFDQKPEYFNKIIAINPTFFAPIPTFLSSLPISLDFYFIREFIRWFLFVDFTGPGLWKLLSSPSRISKYVCNRLFSSSPSSLCNDDNIIAEKQYIAHYSSRPRYPFSSFVCGGMDLISEYREIEQLFYSVDKERIIIIKGGQMKKQELLIMKKIETEIGIKTKEIKEGRLLLHQEYPHQILEICAEEKIHLNE